jgi:uncharacterized membrane protein YfcA
MSVLFLLEYAMDLIFYIVAGASVGFIVGLTGIGGGALMTPLLLLFGFPANIAIGTDLMYAAITKASGVYSHHNLHHIQWNIVKLLSLGSIPGVILTGIFLTFFFPDTSSYTHILSTTLGIMLLLTAVSIVFRNKIQSTAAKWHLIRNTIGLDKNTLTILMGGVLGILVTLTSVGAGAVGTAILMLLYPALKSSHVVGTDIAHAVPLTLLGGLLHIYLGNVNFYLLGALLIGSIPSIYIGTKVAHHISDDILKPALAIILCSLGIYYAFLS